MTEDPGERSFDWGLTPTTGPAPDPVVSPENEAVSPENEAVAVEQQTVRERPGRRAVIGGATGLAVLLALGGLFLLGTWLPELLASSPAATPPIPTKTSTPTPTPTPTVAATGPVAAGIHGWNELLGGECLSPYISPWAEKFTVVDCAAPHPAQMVFRGTFDPTATPTFPGTGALQAQISLLCAAPGVLDLAAATQYSDAQVQGSYPVTQAQWDAGQRDYFCFLSRSSGQPLTGSVAVARS